MKRAQDEVKMTKMSCRCCQRRGSHRAFGLGWAYGYETKDSGPECVIW